jgi:hypothetical protein
MYSTTTATLTAEQLKAIRLWAGVHGRTWKAALRLAWETGNYEGIEQYGNEAAYLQQVRNTFGPSWLVRFVLPKDGGFTVFDSIDSAIAAEKSGMVL